MALIEGGRLGDQVESIEKQLSCSTHRRDGIHGDQEGHECEEDPRIVPGEHTRREKREGPARGGAFSNCLNTVWSLGDSNS